MPTDGAVLGSVPGGGFMLGSGGSTTPPNRFDGGNTTRMRITTCAGTLCSLGPSDVATEMLSCTAPSTLRTARSASLGFTLSANVWLTGDAAAPCPRCVTGASGSPEAPQEGTCDRGARSGQACTTTSPSGLSRDCLLGGTDGGVALGAITFPISGLTTGSRVVQAASDGTFCPGQTQPGCFGRPACRRIVVNGTLAGRCCPPGRATPSRLRRCSACRRRRAA